MSKIPCMISGVILPDSVVMPDVSVDAAPVIDGIPLVTTLLELSVTGTYFLLSNAGSLFSLSVPVYSDVIKLLVDVVVKLFWLSVIEVVSVLSLTLSRSSIIPDLDSRCCFFLL